MIGAQNVTYTFVIDKRQLTSAFVTETLTYSGEHLGTMLTISGIQSVDKDIDKLSFETSLELPAGTIAKQITHDATNENGYVIYFKGIDAGSYTASITALIGSAKDNYALPTENSRKFTINKLPISVAWDYEEPFTYDGAEKTITPSVTNAVTRVDTDALDVVTITATQNAKTQAGVYTASVSSVSNSNYTVTNGVGIKQEWQIKERTLTIARWEFTSLTSNGIVGSDRMVYSGNQYALRVVLNNVVDGETVTCDYTNNENTFAGSYTATVKLAESAVNYALTDASVDYEIEQLKVVVSWGASEFTYDGTEKSITATATNRASSDNVTFTYAGNTATNAGTYTASISAVNNANYTINDPILAGGNRGSRRR